MKVIWLAGPVLVALALTGCHLWHQPKGDEPKQPHPDRWNQKFMGSNGVRIPACEDANHNSIVPDDKSGGTIANQNVGAFHIVVPTDIGSQSNTESVKLSTSFVDPDIDDEFPGTVVLMPEPTSTFLRGPFHINLRGWRKANLGVKTGFILVRVVLRDSANSKWKFHDNGNFQGLMVSPDPDGAAICGYSTLNPSSAKFKEGRKFYIDVSKVDWKLGILAAPFNIILERKDWNETPIIIDPKVRNEG